MKILSNQRQNKVKIAAKHCKNHGFEPVFCGNSTKINGKMVKSMVKTLVLQNNESDSVPVFQQLNPLTLFIFSCSGLPISGNHFFSQQFSNWASKTPRAYGSYCLLYSHSESSRKWPQEIPLNQTWLYLMLALFIWGDGFCFGVVF